MYSKKVMRDAIVEYIEWKSKYRSGERTKRRKEVSLSLHTTIGQSLNLRIRIKEK